MSDQVTDHRTGDLYFRESVIAMILERRFWIRDRTMLDRTFWSPAPAVIVSGA